MPASSLSRSCSAILTTPPAMPSLTSTPFSSTSSSLIFGLLGEGVATLAVIGVVSTEAEGEQIVLRTFPVCLRATTKMDTLKFKHHSPTDTGYSTLHDMTVPQPIFLPFAVRLVSSTSNYCTSSHVCRKI